jgi:oxygen-independent coproporphyrinogen-3 oxidase
MVEDRNNALGIYISVPFCRSKCTYCNFASGVYPASEQAHYVERVTQDLASAGAWAAQMGVELPRRVDTIYLGGGTPSLLRPELMARLFAAIAAEFTVIADAEITVECAPGQLAEDTLAAMANSGVNRVSLGVQSFVDREAQQSGRLHTSAIVSADIERLRDAGIANINVDLIAGLAGQTLASWQHSLDALLALRVPHASVYMLEVDEDSRLGREMLSGGARYHAGLVPSDETIARMYTMAIERLAVGVPNTSGSSADGLDQYEISNFSRAGFRSRHNLRYWQRRSYLGLGLDASSMLRATPEVSPARDAGYVLRATTTDDLAAFQKSTGWQETAWLSPARQFEEAWFLGLRLNAGVELAALEREFGAAAMAPALRVVDRLAANDLLTVTDGRVRLTAQGQLLSNEVFQEFLGLTPELEFTGR